MSYLRLIGVVIVIGLLALPTFTVAGQTTLCAVPTGSLLPDLVPNKQILNQNIVVNTQTFPDGDCNLVEGAVPTSGPHKLLWFDAGTDNAGKADLLIGDPVQCPALFEFSTCHQHNHIKSYSAYRLWTVAGFKAWLSARDLSLPVIGTNNALFLAQAEASGQLVTGHKQGFCMEDNVCGSSNNQNSTGTTNGAACWTDVPGWQRRSTGKFTCANQGLTIGWTDVYYGWSDKYQSGLDGQFIVIDAVPPGKYVLEVQVNPDQVLPESSYTNNSTYTYVDIK